MVTGAIHTSSTMEINHRYIYRHPSIVFFVIVISSLSLRVGIMIGRTQSESACLKFNVEQNDFKDASRPSTHQQSAVPTYFARPLQKQSRRPVHKKVMFKRPSPALKKMEVGSIQFSGPEGNKNSIANNEMKKMTVIGDKKLGETSSKIKANPDYVQIREADSPRLGDFNCGRSAIQGCCAFYVSNIEEAKKMCHSFGDYCKGFVFSTVSPSAEKVEYVMYLKNDVTKMTINFLTDFFVKSKFMKSISWKHLGF